MRKAEAGQEQNENKYRTQYELLYEDAKRRQLVTRQISGKCDDMECTFTPNTELTKNYYQYSAKISARSKAIVQILNKKNESCLHRVQGSFSSTPSHNVAHHVRNKSMFYFFSTKGVSKIQSPNILPSDRKENIQPKIMKKRNMMHQSFDLSANNGIIRKNKEMQSIVSYMTSISSGSIIKRQY
jgi:hypothetical protein